MNGTVTKNEGAKKPEEGQRSLLYRGTLHKQAVLLKFAMCIRNCYTVNRWKR